MMNFYRSLCHLLVFNLARAIMHLYNAMRNLTVPWTERRYTALPKLFPPEQEEEEEEEYFVKYPRIGNLMEGAQNFCQTCKSTIDPSKSDPPFEGYPESILVVLPFQTFSGALNVSEVLVQSKINVSMSGARV